jgi:hypothetical protein
MAAVRLLIFALFFLACVPWLPGGRIAISETEGAPNKEVDWGGGGHSAKRVSNGNPEMHYTSRTIYWYSEI